MSFKCKTNESNHPDNFCYLCTAPFKKHERKLPLKSEKIGKTTIYYDLFRRCYDPVLKGGDAKSKKETVLYGLNSDFAPSFVCQTCYSRMSRFQENPKNPLVIEKPPVWNKMKPDHSDCFFCSYSVGRHAKAPETSSIVKPVQFECSAGRKRKLSPAEKAADSSSPSASTASPMNQSSDLSFILSSPPKHSLPFIKYNQKSLNNLIRRLRLSKDGAVQLASDLYNRNGLEPGCKVSFYKDRGAELDEYFEEFSNDTHSFVYMKDIEGFFRKFCKMEFDPDEWRLFIDSSMSSLKAVLLHNGSLPEVPVFYSKTLKEDYKFLKVLLDSINYSKYELRICADLKVLAILRGIKGGNVSFPCLKCFWNSRAYSTHYSAKGFGSRDHAARPSEPKRRKSASSTAAGQSAEQPGSFSEVLPPLVDPKKLLLPPLHVKLGLFSQLIKSIFRQKGTTQDEMMTSIREDLEEDEELLNYLYEIDAERLEGANLVEDALADHTNFDLILNEKTFEGLPNEYGDLVVFLKRTFPYKSNEKIKQGIFNGPEIRQLIKLRGEFESVQPQSFKEAWKSFVLVVEGFLGNTKSPDYKLICEELVENYRKQGCLMSVKVHYINEHVEDFPQNCGMLSEEKGERFHQEVRLCEDRFSRNYNKAMMMDYCWFLVDELEEEFVKKRKSSRRSFEQSY